MFEFGRIRTNPSPAVTQRRERGSRFSSKVHKDDTPPCRNQTVKILPGDVTSFHGTRRGNVVGKKEEKIERKKKRIVRGEKSHGSRESRARSRPRATLFHALETLYRSVSSKKLQIPIHLDRVQGRRERIVTWIVTRSLGRSCCKRRSTGHEREMRTPVVAADVSTSIHWNWRPDQRRGVHEIEAWVISARWPSRQRRGSPTSKTLFSKELRHGSRKTLLWHDRTREIFESQRNNYPLARWGTFSVISRLYATPGSPSNRIEFF